MMACNIIAGYSVAIGNHSFPIENHSLFAFLYCIVATIPFYKDFNGLTGFDLSMLLLNGMLVLPIAFVLLTIAPSLISAPEVSLYMLIETVLAPIWVWLAGFEAPPVSAWIGGAILLAALVTHRQVFISRSRLFLRLTINLLARSHFEKNINSIKMKR